MISTTTQPTLTTWVARSRTVMPVAGPVACGGPRTEQGSGLSAFGVSAFGPFTTDEHGCGVSAFGSRTRYAAPMQVELDAQKLPVADNGISKVVVDDSSGYRTWSPPV